MMATNYAVRTNRPPTGVACIPCKAKNHFCQADLYEDESDTPLCDGCARGFKCGHAIKCETVQQDRDKFLRRGQPKKTGVPPNALTHEEETTLLSAEQIADKGIRTSQNFIEFMAALMADVVSGRVSPKAAQAACHAGRNLLEAVRLQRQYAERPNEGVVLALPSPGEDRK